MERTAILGIDLQNDFTTPTGALYVDGADRDVLRIATFIKNNGPKIDYIALTLDSHQPIHVAHQCYWKNKNGDFPELFSKISYDDVKSGIWIPQYNSELALPYLERLGNKGIACTIWPMHCILGSLGWALNDILVKTLSEWSIANDRSYELFYKGYIQSTEHYSIFRAAVEWEGIPETSLNVHLLDTLDRYDRVILVGEAADFCVSNSLHDIVLERPDLAQKIVVLTDCMSWIIKDNPLAIDIYSQARKTGVKFVEVETYIL